MTEALEEALSEGQDGALAPSAVVSTFRTARVNLLPPEIEEARRLRRTQAALAGGLLGVVAILGAGYAYEVHGRHGAERELAEAKAQATVLQREQDKYADVPRTVAAIDAAETARQTAMANDVEWSRTLTDFSLTMPEDVWFSNLTLNVGSATGSAGGPAGAGAAAGATSGAAATTSGAAAETPGAAAAGVGTVTVEGQARRHRDVATWLDTLGQRPGMTSPYFTSSQNEKVGTKTVVKFSSTATLTADALSHRYDRKQD